MKILTEHLSSSSASAEHALAQLIVETLNLDVAPSSIDPEAPLFGEGLGLELDRYARNRLGGVANLWRETPRRRQQ